MVSAENLFRAWDVFKSEKLKKPDVQLFERNLEENIFQLHRELKNKTYEHGPYKGFYITDPKQRHIHKALVRDRVLHHAIFSVINPIFEPTFISTSYSCRIGYGTHRGVEKLAIMMRSVSRNGTRSCFILKCDIKKFFDSVDHAVLLGILKKRIKDQSAVWLLERIIASFGRNKRERERETKMPGQECGIPIGNLTSQLFANIYMNEFDQFVKHTLGIKNYVRYTDDFVIVTDNKPVIADLLPRISEFLQIRLKLTLHPKKIKLYAAHQGVDFLGYVGFPKYRLLRTKTKRRMIKKLEKRAERLRLGKGNSNSFKQSLQSYLGVLSHADAYDLGEELKNQFGIFGTSD